MPRIAPIVTVLFSLVLSAAPLLAEPIVLAKASGSGSSCCSGNDLSGVRHGGCQNGCHHDAGSSCNCGCGHTGGGHGHDDGDGNGDGDGDGDGDHGGNQGGHHGGGHQADPMKAIRKTAKTLSGKSDDLQGVIGEEIRGTWWDWSSFTVNDEVQKYLALVGPFATAVKRPADDDDDSDALRGGHDHHQPKLRGKEQFQKLFAQAKIVNDLLKKSRSLTTTKQYWSSTLLPMMGQLARIYAGGDGDDGDDDGLTLTAREQRRVGAYAELTSRN